MHHPINLPSLGFGLFLLVGTAAAETPASPPSAPVAYQAEDIMAKPLPGDAADVLAGEAGGLTARQVGERSVLSSQTVRRKLAELDVARAKEDEVRARYLPRLSLRASYTRASSSTSQLTGTAMVGALNEGPLLAAPCPGGAGTCITDSKGTPVQAEQTSIEAVRNRYALGAQLNVPVSDYVLRLSNDVAAASHSTRAADMAAKAEQLKARSDAQALFYEWLRAKARVGIAETSLERVRARLREAQHALEVGTAAPADVLRLEAQAARTEQIVLEAKSYRDLSELQLSVALGESQSVRHVSGEIIPSAPAANTDTVDSLTSEALSSRLELVAVRESVLSAAHAADAAGVGRWPRLDAFADLNYANPNPRYFPEQAEWKSSWAVGAAATWTLGDVYINSATHRQIEGERRSLHAQRAALVDAIRIEVQAHYLGRIQAQGALEAARRGLASAQAAYQVASDNFRAGRATTTEIIDAETELLSGRLAEVNARIESCIAELRLVHAVGRDRDLADH